MTQPTALFLADVIDADADAESHHAAAAGELRRLHAQRDALLMALQRMANIIDQMGDMPDGFIHPSPWQELKCEEALAQARAALAHEQVKPVQTTHSEECWRWHHACAVAKLDRMAAEFRCELCGMASMHDVDDGG